MTRPFFVVADVIRVWTSERQDAEDAEALAASRPAGRVPEVSPHTVYAYIGFSRPAKPGKEPNRYEHNPMPLPVYVTGTGEQLAEPARGARPIWLPAAGETLTDLERQLRHWWTSRPGQGAGGGRPSHRRTLAFRDVP